MDGSRNRTLNFGGFNGYYDYMSYHQGYGGFNWYADFLYMNGAGSGKAKKASVGGTAIHA
jgi:hypothetical protein